MAKELIVNRRNFTLRSHEEEAARRELDAHAVSQVVLIEDDVEMRRMLAWALRRDGHHVIEAGNGREALEILGSLLLDQPAANRRATLVVSDVRLPHFSGLEILEALRICSRRVPVILMTAFGDAELHRLAHEFGALEVLDKPFDVDELRRAVRASLPV